MKDNVPESEQYYQVMRTDREFVDQGFNSLPNTHSMDGDSFRPSHELNMVDLSQQAVPALSMFNPPTCGDVDVKSFAEQLVAGKASSVPTRTLSTLTKYIEWITGFSRRDAEIAGPLNRMEMQAVMERLQAAVRKFAVFFGFAPQGFPDRTAWPERTGRTELSDFLASAQHMP